MKPNFVDFKAANEAFRRVMREKDIADLESSGMTREEAEAVADRIRAKSESESIESTDVWHLVESASGQIRITMDSSPVSQR